MYPHGIHPHRPACSAPDGASQELPPSGEVPGAAAPGDRGSAGRYTPSGSLRSPPPPAGEAFGLPRASAPAGKTGVSERRGDSRIARRAGRLSIRHLIRRPARGGSPADTFPSGGRLAGFGPCFADGNTDCMSAWRMIEYSKKAARRRRGLVRRRNRRTQRGEDQP